MGASFLSVPDRTHTVTAIPTESKKRELRWT
jgi:hypothetical protein